MTNDPDYWQTRQNGEVTHYNLVHYEFLQDMIWLEGHIGTPEKVAQYTADAAALKDAINTRLFNSAAGLYQHTDSRPDVFPLDANMNAVKLGVAPDSYLQHILERFRAAWVARSESPVSPSMADPVTIEPLNTREMLAGAATTPRVRRPDAAAGACRSTDAAVHRDVLGVLQNGPRVAFDACPRGAQGQQVLTEAVVGASAVDPGYATWEVKPQPVDLSWAQGQVPTAYGPLLVKWAQDDHARAGAADGRFHLEVTAPAGTRGEVWVPLSSTDKSVRALTPGPNLLRRDQLRRLASEKGPTSSARATARWLLHTDRPVGTARAGDAGHAGLVLPRSPGPREHSHVSQPVPSLACYTSGGRLSRHVRQRRRPEWSPHPRRPKPLSSPAPDVASQRTGRAWYWDRRATTCDLSVVRTVGTVSNADVLVSQGTGTASLTVPRGAPAAVVLDFGKEVGGTPFIVVSSSTASSATVRISTSEALSFLTTSSGAFTNDNGSQINFTVGPAQRYTGGLRGGFRFAAIELRTAGTVRERCRRELQGLSRRLRTGIRAGSFPATTS